MSLLTQTKLNKSKGGNKESTVLMLTQASQKYVSSTLKKILSITCVLISVSPGIASALVCGTPEETSVAESIQPFDMSGLAVSAGTPNLSKTVTLTDGREITVTAQYISGSGYDEYPMSTVRPSGKFMSQFVGVTALRTNGIPSRNASMMLTISPASNVVWGDAETMGMAEVMSLTTNGGVWEQIDGTTPDDDLLVTGLETKTTSLTGLDGRSDNDFVLMVSRNATQLDLNIVANVGKSGFFIAFTGTDNGDAESSYGPAPHLINQFTSCSAIGSGNFIGSSLPDAENPTETYSSDATGDDANNSGQADDEGGVTIPTLVQGTANTISLPVTGAGSFLQAWIDWNDDGDFAGENEQIATNLQDSDGDGNIDISVNIPAVADVSQTFARFRWSTISGLSSNAFAIDGEVEDYSITIIAQPIADDDSETNRVIGTPTTIDIIDGDTDADGDTTIDASTVSIISNDATDTDGDGDNDQLILANEGTWSVDNTTGEMTFTPLASFTGDPTPVKYTVNDDTGLTSNEATVSINYGEAPIVDNDGAANPTVGTNTEVNVLLNDSDPDGGTLILASVQIVGTANPGDPLVVPGEGTWTVDTSTGFITFDPIDGFIGDPTVIRYTVDDDDGNTSDPATVTVTYGEPPLAVDDNAANPVIGSLTTINVVTNDSDLEDTTVDVATVQIIDPSDGSSVSSLVVTGQGTWTVVPGTGEITFMPETGYTGDPTPIQYTVDDSDGNTSNPAAVNVSYGEAPIASPDGAANPTVGTPTTINVVSNDNDTDGTIDITSVQIIDPANPGTPVTSLSVPTEGTWSVNTTTGEITFTPIAGFTGDPTPISYTVNDNNGNVSEPATVTVTYGDEPEATDDTQLNPVIGSDTIVNVVGNDNDTDGTIDPMTVQIVGPSGPVSSLVVANQGTWTVDATTGAITFAPLASFTGDPDPITYTVNDNSGNPSNAAIVTVTYGEAPIVTNDSKANPVIGTSTTVELISNDGDSDGNIDLNSVQLVGTANPGDPLTVPNEGVWTVNPGTGTITFTPLASFTGDPTAIAYTLLDNDGNGSNEAMVTVTYGDAPVVESDGAANPTVGTNTEVNVLANDGDPDGGTLIPATVQIAGTANPGDPLVVAGEGTWTINPTTGAITFDPIDGFISDPTVIRYTVEDNDGNVSDPATVTVTYGEPPLAVDDNAVNPVVGSLTTINVVTNDSDLEDTTVDVATVQLIDPSDGSSVSSLVVTGQGTWTVVPGTGEITFMPETGFTGDPTPVQYTVDDSDGNTSNPAAVNVAYGDAPIANPDGVANPTLGSPTPVNVVGNDNDIDGNIDPTTVKLIDPSGNPVTTLSVTGGEWTLTPAGVVTFTPDPGFTGDPAPIMYTVEDNNGNVSAPASITVTYGDGPEATDDIAFNPTLGSDTIVDVLSNDNDPDGMLDPATITIAGSAGPGASLVVPNQGEWIVDTTTGSIVFAPLTGFTGNPDSITYTVDDDAGNTSNPATVTVTYGQAPIATDDSKENPTIGSPTVIELVSNDGDSDGSIDLDTVQIVGTANPGDPLVVTGGEWTVNAGTGTITFTPDPGFTGDPAPIAYVVSDNSGNVSNEANVSVTYGKPPIAVDDTVTSSTMASTGGIVMINVIDMSDSDPDSLIDLTSVDLDPSTPGIDSTFTNDDGTYTVDATGVVTFTPVDGLRTSPTPIGYTVNDIFGNTSNVAMINISFAAEAIPTLSEWMLIMLTMLLMMVGLKENARKTKRKLGQDSVKF